MLFVLNKLNTSPITMSEGRSPNLNCFVRRRSKELNIIAETDIRIDQRQRSAVLAAVCVDLGNRRVQLCAIVEGAATRVAPELRDARAVVGKHDVHWYAGGQRPQG